MLGGGGRMLATGRHARVRLALFIGIGLATTGLVFVALGLHLLRDFEFDSVDARFSVRGTQPRPADLLVVAIDEHTFDSRQDGGLGLQWPLPRRWHARALNR